MLWQVILFFLLECFYASILLGVYLILDFQLKSFQSTAVLNDSAGVQEQTLNEYEQKFRDTNEAVDATGKIERFHLHFTEVFLLLGNLLPEGVRINRLNTKDFTIMLSGIATKRENLLTFEDNLKSSTCVSDVNVPISNLFSQENVDFQIDFSIDADCLRKK